METKNKLLIAVAGAGKTTYLIERAFEIISKNPAASILITTYTRSNAAQIREKIKKENIKRNGISKIPNNITVQEWFSFLLKEGVRPYKAMMHERLKFKSISLYPDFQYNNNIYRKEENILEHYFLDYKIIVNSLSKFVVKANVKSEGALLNRISNLYTHIFIDEVQDLAGYDLDLIRELFKSSISLLLVGDPRQVTYLTHHENINSKYKNGNIKNYIIEKCKDLNCQIDEKTLVKSHRNNKFICDFSSLLYPLFERSIPCNCPECRKPASDEGIFILKDSEVEIFKDKYRNENIGILKWHKAVNPEKNFGDSKGITYDRVLLYPTGTIISYLKDGMLTKNVKNKKGKIEQKDAFDIAKFYVALTRARHSVGIVYNYKTNERFIDGLSIYPNQ